MGMDATGILAYGYDLGGPETGWNFNGLARLDNEDEDLGTFDERVNDILLKEFANFVNPPWDDEARKSNDFWKRFSEAEKQVPVHVVEYGVADYPSYILAIKDKSYDAPDYGILTLDEDDALETDQSHVDQLNRALAALGVTDIVNDDKPNWHVASYFG